VQARDQKALREAMRGLPSLLSGGAGSGSSSTSPAAKARDVYLDGMRTENDRNSAVSRSAHKSPSQVRNLGRPLCRCLLTLPRVQDESLDLAMALSASEVEHSARSTKTRKASPPRRRRESRSISRSPRRRRDRSESSSPRQRSPAAARAASAARRRSRTRSPARSVSPVPNRSSFARKRALAPRSPSSSPDRSGRNLEQALRLAAESDEGRRVMCPFVAQSA
jgi:hypothetical protein